MRDYKRFIQILCSLLFIFFSSNGFAAVFSIVPAAGHSLPTAITKGSSVTAYYTVSNLATITLSNNFVKYLPPNVNQVTNDSSVTNLCGAAFTLTPNASCTLELNITGGVNGSDGDPYHHIFVCTHTGFLCAGTPDPLNVVESNNSNTKTIVSIAITPLTSTLQRMSSEQFTALATYADGTTANVTSAVAWNSTNPNIASISPAGVGEGLIGGSTQISASSGSVVSNQSALTVLSFMYIVNNGAPLITYCPINNDGTLGTCNGTGTGFFQPQATALDLTNKFSYTTDFNFSSAVTTCSISAVNGSLTNCFNTTVGVQLTGVTINSSGTMLYLVDHESPAFLTYCNINSGVPTNCNTISISASSPTGITINSANTFLFVGDNLDPVVYACGINPDGSIGSCNGTGSGFNGAQSIVLNPAGTFAYVTNIGSDNVSFCSVNGGILTGCAITGPGINAPAGLAISPTGTYIYIGSSGDNTISICPVNPNGTIGTSCILTGNNTHVPNALAVG